MKKIFLLLSFTLLILQSCSSGDSDNNTNTTTVSDIDGNVYQTVTICNQTWTKSNLNVSKYRNGDVIPQVQDATQWASLTTGAWCYYNNDPANGAIYGKLYNWHAVNDPRGLAPSGYHIPTDAEWTSLINCLGGEAVAGGKMKEAGTAHWTSPNTGATNESGFTGLPGGKLKKISVSDFQFIYLQNNGVWWSSTEFDTDSSWFCKLDYNSTISMIDKHIQSTGCSLRIIKD